MDADEGSDLFVDLHWSQPIHITRSRLVLVAQPPPPPVPLLPPPPAPFEPARVSKQQMLDTISRLVVKHDRKGGCNLKTANALLREFKEVNKKLRAPKETFRDGVLAGIGKLGKLRQLAWWALSKTGDFTTLLDQVIEACPDD